MSKLIAAVLDNLLVWFGKRISKERFKAGQIFFFNVKPSIRLHMLRNYIWYGRILSSGRRASWEKKIGINIPETIIVDITNKCNLRCIGCFAQNYQIKPRLNLEILDNFITQVKELGINNIVFSGGEPFIEKKSLIYLLKKHHDLIFAAFTNGTLIDKKITSQLAECGNIVLLVSVEGLQQNTDARRGNGVFEKAVNAMDLLHLQGIPFGYSVTCTKNNAEDIVSEEFIELMVSKGNMFGLYLVFHPTSISDLPLLPTPEQRLMIHKRVTEIRLSRTLATADHHDAYLIGGCPATKRYLHINSKGDVKPCPMLPFAAGNILESPLVDILSSPLIKSFQARQPFHENLLRPCPMIDHPKILREIITEGKPYPTLAGVDTFFKCAGGLDDYADSWGSLADPYWQTEHKKP